MPTLLTLKSLKSTLSLGFLGQSRLAKRDSSPKGGSPVTPEGYANLIQDSEIIGVKNMERKLL
jgi:hypothetical protein